MTLGQCALYTYILSITLLPLGFGGHRDFPLGLSQAGLAVSALIIAFERSMLSACYWPRRIQLALALFGMVLLWGFLQTQSFMPSEWHHPLWQESSKALQTPIDGSIALWREEAFFSLNRLTTYIATGLLAYILAADPARARLMLQALWYSGIALCCYGYFNVMTGSTHVLWVEKMQYQHDFTSTFVSKNHFAIYASLVLLAGCALLHQSWKNTLRDTRSISFKRSLENVGLWVKDKAFFQLCLVLYVFGAIVLSHCRSGLILSVLGIATFFICYQLYARKWNHAILLAGIAMCFGTLVFLIAATSSDHFARLFVDESTGNRLSVYHMCLAAIADNPLLGYGFGSFEAVFRMYNQTVSWSFNYAHSDLLESLVDLGLPAGLLLWGAIALLFSGIVRGLFKRRRQGMYPTIGVAASLVVLIHSGIDFSLQIPGVAMPFAMITGMALAQSWGSSEKTGRIISYSTARPTPDPTAQPPLNHPAHDVV